MENVKDGKHLMGKLMNIVGVIETQAMAPAPSSALCNSGLQFKICISVEMAEEDQVQVHGQEKKLDRLLNWCS